MNVVYRVDWTETERGWGDRPDGTTFYSSKEEAQKHIDEHWAWYKEEYGDQAPHEYSYPSDPSLFELKDEKLYEEVKKKGKVSAHARYYRQD